jgi:hypothetical protein
MPPETITNVMPTAMMPMKAVRVSTFIMLSMVAKSGFSRAAADAQQDQRGQRGR